MRTHANCINDFLSPELLWTVFFMNATHDVWAKKRLQTTIRSTHVCRAWRTLLLENSSIWGHLIYVEHKERQREKEIEMMHEILRRSGESLPLSVHADLRNYRSGQGYRKFLDHVLINYWPRIQRLEIHFAGIVRRSHKNHFLSYLTRPSPSLCICDIHVGSRWSVGQAPDREIGISPPLFGDIAPNLHFLGGDYLAISPNAPWLSGLTTFGTNYHSKFTTSVLQTLGVLSGLPQLSHLELRHKMSETVPNLASISSYPLVHLPNLKYLVVQGPPEICLALVDRIQRPSTCLVSAKAVNFDDSHVTQDLEAIGEQLFIQTFLRMLEPTYPAKLTWLFISLSYDSVTLADKNCFPTSIRSMPRFCPIICVAGSYLFFSPLSSDYSVDTLVGLCKQGNSSYSLSFPNLEILSVMLFSRYAPAFEGEDDHPVDNGSDYVDPIVSFLRPRKIKILRVYTAFIPYWRRVFTEDERMMEALLATKLKLLPIDYEEDNDLFWDSEESMSDGEYAEGED